MSDHYLGLISGTSADGIDAALVRITDNEGFTFIAARGRPYPDHIREGLTALDRDEPGALLRLGELDTALGELFAEAALDLIRDAGLRPAAVRAIGSHGQTVLHRPDRPHPFSLQIGQPAVIVQRTGITTVADFRPRDMAAGGEGAPLAPAFHDAVLRKPGTERAILNLGGIANLTRLGADPGSAVIGFDSGPANTLLDAWFRRHHDGDYDHDGDWAASGKVCEPLLLELLSDPYFSTPPPKSTGPELFNLAWLSRAIERGAVNVTEPDVQTTLLELTAVSVVESIRRHIPKVDEVLVCGGGVHNRALMQRLDQLLQPAPVRSTAQAGLDPDWVEACAFAWLAWRTLNGEPGNLPSVTGASQAVPLGAIWPATRPAGIDAETFTDGG